MTFEAAQMIWIPSVRADNPHYLSVNTKAQGLAAVVFRTPRPDGDNDRRVCWDAFQTRVSASSPQAISLLVYAEPTEAASQARLHQLRKNVVKTAISESLQHLFDADSAVTYRHGNGIFVAAIPLRIESRLWELNSLLLARLSCRLVTQEDRDLSRWHALVRRPWTPPENGYQTAPSLVEFIHDHPVVSVTPLGHFEEPEKTVLAMGKAAVLTNLMGLDPTFAVP